MEFERRFAEEAASLMPREDVVAWCREPASRLCWPGASDVRSQGAVIYFTLNMQAPGGPRATGVMEEYLGALHETEAGSVEFASMITLTWPSGEVASGQSTYRFNPGSRPGTATLAFSLDYVLPRKLGVGRLNRDRFLAAIDRALSLYVSRLANGPSVEAPHPPEGVGSAR